VTTEVVWVEKPLQEILIHLKEQPMAALIKALAHESRLSRLLFTPLDIHLLRECPVPLHFVSHMHHALPRKIVAAIDPFHREGQYQDFNDRILQEASKLAITCHAELDVVYAHDLSSISADEFGFENASTFSLPAKPRPCSMHRLMPSANCRAQRHPAGAPAHDHGQSGEGACQLRNRL
jgi:universal stress protein E